MPNNTPPSLATLTDRFLRTAAADTSTMATTEVEPHEVLTGHRIDSRSAWNDAVAVFQFLNLPRPTVVIPAEWASTVQREPARSAMPICLGTYPQAVRDVGVVLDVLARKAKLSRTRVGELAVAAVKLPANDTPFAKNEQAATLWFAGDSEAALELWQAMPANPVSQFNCGMALLFMNRASEARVHLQAAAEALPEQSGWAHLAKLYLTLAEMPAV